MSQIRRRTGFAVATAVAVLLGGLTTPSSATAEGTITAAPATDHVEIHRTTSEAGFSHPGVGLTADNLENMRTQVLAGVEPWASYYEAMSQTRYAATDFRASIQGPTDETPTATAYDNASMRSRQHTDSIGAMTQALLYVVTGDEVYRANALRVIRTWSSLDPARYRYFGDSHIHTGVPLYQTLVAAEILRSTEPVHDSLDGYDLRWTERDTQRITDNLIDPVLDTFLFSQNRLWNQHLYGVIGMVAAAIFTDDADLYAERVEWFTVNSTYTPQIPINGGDVSGSVADLVRVIDADHPANTTGRDFVQVMEMGRDQAHAEGDVDLMTSIARVVNNQGTRLDPVHGTVSTGADAVSPYEFLGNRILSGGDTFYAFMMGKDLPWVDTSGGQGKLSQAYRGRVREPLAEIYLQYKYVADVDVEHEAPYVAEMYAHRDGPLYYSGTRPTNFWNEAGSDFTGAEYWVAFPPELAEEDVAVPVATSPELSLHQFGHPLGKGAKQLTDQDGTSFTRLKTHKPDATVAVRRTVWPDRSRTALVGLKIRTDGTATVHAARTLDADPFDTIEVPDTHGAWRYVWMDVSTAHVPRIGDNIVYLTATGSRAHVDVASVLADANATLSPPVLEDAPTLDVVAVAGEPYTRRIGASDPDGAYELSLQGAPDGVRLADDGTMTWLPSAESQKDTTSRFLVVASDDEADTTLPVTVTVARDRTGAIDALTDDLQERDAYTATTWQPVAEALAAAREGIGGTDSAAFGILLEDLRVAVAGLELLNPRLADGTLDYSRIVTSADLSSTALAAIVDGDNQTFWGDLSRPSVLLDFGAGYRFRADAFGWLARDTFPDRSHGANAYGSNDGSTWTLLTEHATEGSDTAMETIPVRANARDQEFRYLKLQADQPTHVIFSMADLRIHGERREADPEGLVAKTQDLSRDARPAG
ncbi:hypothetical protein ACIG47_19195 [Promicromonospora sp. NPDC052451]|uniref:hypothetical protein n=1 Tax=Promicromonospora sp. NPDC052451 TaxID=3364407 RepID=UPI0037C55D44